MSRRLVAPLALLVFVQLVLGGVREYSSMYVASTLRSCKAGDQGGRELK